MIPETENTFIDLENINQPSLTYGLDLTRKRITRKIDGYDAIFQAVEKILFTERYSYVIYSSQYGVELNRFIGKDYDFIISDIQRVIEESLLIDDRILGVSDFEINQTNIDSMTISFLVNSIEGEKAFNMEVNVI